MTSTNEQAGAGAQTTKLSLAAKAVRGFWMLAAAVGIGATVWTLLEPGGHEKPDKTTATPPRQINPIRVTGPGTIMLQADSPMRGQLKFEKVEASAVTFPIFTVSGSILARVIPGDSPLEERWQFASTDLSLTYSDWIRTKNDLEFAERIMTKAKQLSDAEINFRKSVFDRLEPLGQSKVVPERDVKAAKADLLRAEISGEREVFETQRVVFADRKAVATLERTLRQTGLDLEILTKTEENTVLISANVPESRIADVHIDQLCQVHLFGIPGQVFPAHVEAMATSVTSDRRMLKLVFHLVDPKNVMKPGMFGEVGLGTNARDAILIPAKAIVHLGSLDYVLVADGAETLKVREVKTGEPHQDRYEILEGLTSGETIISQGAVLLKPLVRDALIQEETN